ncbi:hypothetical protein WJX82_008644 [Trebouxia sp. C0006]
MKRKLPPALPWRPVTDMPPPGVFCTGEVLESYAFLPSATVSRGPAQASRDQNEPRAAPAPAAIIPPTVSRHSSDDEVLSAEQPQRGLKRASAFTMEEHGYLLDLHDVRLEGKDAGKFESLKARMENEQREYLKQLRSKAFADRHRYTSCHPEAAHQIQAELLAQRSVVQGLPKLWQVAKLFSLQSIEQRKPRDPGMRHMATISRQGLPAVFSMPQPLTPIPLDQPCMPSLLTQQAAVSAPLPAFNTDHPNLPPIAPTTTTAQTDSTPGLADVPLHQDGFCNSNPACQQADLLMTEGAFACLTGIWAPSYRLAWELPVTIRAANSAPDSGDPETCPPSEQHAKQVIIDSPLPRRMLSLREKHELLYQHAVASPFPQVAVLLNAPFARPPGQPPPGPMPLRLRNKLAVLGVKMEYLEEWGFEMLLADELARWWAAVLLHPQPNCELVVAKVGVHSSHLLGIQAKSRGWVMQECSRQQVDISHVQRLIPLLMGQLQDLAPGQYLLTHEPGEAAVSCFTAQINATQDEPGSLGVPLPCGHLGVRKGTVYDLHAAHVNSGATDTEQDLFAGAWQQADPEIDQVPFTFPPVHGPSKMGRGKRAKRGIFRGRGAPRQNGGQAARGRGQGRAFIQHPAKLLPKPAKPSKVRHTYVPPEPAPRRGVSAADYAQALDQGL